MYIDKIKRILNAAIAKILCVFGWIYDRAMRVLNAVNKTPIEKDKDRRNIRVKQFAIATSVVYIIINSIFIYVIKSLRSISTVNGSADYSKTHFMPWNIIVPPGFMMFIFELILSLIVGLGITVKLHTLYRMKNDSKNVKGDNKFMEDNELLDHFLAVPMDNITSAEKAGMLIGESNGVYYIEPGTYNTMTVGAPRSGKGECYVLPSLRLMANAKEKPSVIVNDMKGELLELTYKEFARNGYKIVTLNLIDTDRSDCWNPLQLIIDEYLTAKHGNNDLSQTSKLVSSFAHCLTDDTQSEAIWTDSARSLLSALIYYFLDKGYEKNDMSCVNMFSITTFFTEFGIYNTVIEDESGNKKEVNALDELFNALPVGCLARTSYSTSKFSQGETRSSIYTVLSGDLEIFMTDMGVQKLTSKSEIKFNDLIDIDRPCIIYMLVPYEEKSRYVIASMFADQSFLYLAKQARKFPDGKLPRKIEYMYDEFGQMTKLPDLSSKMNASPGANTLFNLFLQDYGQLKKYEKEEDGIKGGCNIQIYILSLNGNTNKAFSEMIGNETVNYLTFSGSLYGFLDHQGERVDSKALLDTTQLSKLPFGTAIVKKMRCEPIKTNITPYHLLPNKMPRIPIDELPIKSRNIDLSAAMYPYDELWDSLGVIGYQYRLDSLKKTAERAMNDYYMQLGKIDQIKSDGGTVPESMYKAALEFEKNAGAAQRQVIEYQQQVQKLNEFRANEARKIFAEAYGTSGSDEEDDDYTDQDELYFPGEYPDDGPYVDITALLYKINGLVGSELGGFLSDQNYAAARGYIKKIQKRPDIRSNFVADEWVALEQYINNEELKNANT
jgi:type IV secretion system protein VirD4